MNIAFWSLKILGIYTPLSNLLLAKRKTILHMLCCSSYNRPASRSVPLVPKCRVAAAPLLQCASRSFQRLRQEPAFYTPAAFGSGLLVAIAVKDLEFSVQKHCPWCVNKRFRLEQWPCAVWSLIRILVCVHFLCEEKEITHLLVMEYVRCVWKKWAGLVEVQWYARETFNLLWIKFTPPWFQRA